MNVATPSQSGTPVETVSFADFAQLLEFLPEAAEKGHAVLPSTTWPLPPKVGEQIRYRLDIGALKRIIEHTKSDQVMSVDTGITIADLQAQLQESGQWFPVEVPHNWLLADVINRGQSGALEHGFGGPRDLTLGLTCALASGKSIKCGGKVVKNVTGYDLTRLFTGAYGSLCVPVSTSLRLYAVPERRSTASFAFSTLTDAWTAATRLRKSGLPFSAMEILDKNTISLVAGMLKSEMTLDVSPAFQLCVEASGSTSLVEEIWKTAKVMCGDPVTTVENSADHLFWLYAGFPDEYAGKHRVEIAGHSKTLLELAGALPDSVSLSVRPGRNKLFVWTASRVAAVELVNSLNSGAANRNMSIAFASEELIWDVRRAASDEAQRALRQRLKTEFDPSAILNPLVSI